ncbi:MAG: PEP/pyruvate-binding domain-containing protein [Coriobacteriia bacterium]|nr:PEP/pyruvate-binding domain-containing protein [Coriobacteriia bacterium]
MVPTAEARAFSVNDETALQVADLALQAEELFGVPVDIEWAYDGECVWLLQARPITTLRETPTPTGVR